MSSSSWWYGICLFPVVLLTTVLSQFGMRTLITSTSGTGDLNVGVSIASFLLSVLSFWGGIVAALIVLVCLVADIRALSGSERWSPRMVWGTAGLLHLSGTVVTSLLFLSTPVLALYLYQRHVHLGTP